MIRSFRDKRTAQIYAGKAPRGVPQDVLRRAMVKLFLLDTATRLQDLGVPPGNELEALKGDRSGQ